MTGDSLVRTMLQFGGEKEAGVLSYLLSLFLFLLFELLSECCSEASCTDFDIPMMYG